MWAATAAVTASAVRPWGRAMIMQKREARSARVATADCTPAPMIRSPSQWPGTARSAASAGRSLMLIIPGICPRASVRGSAGGGGGPGRTARGGDLGAQAALALHEQRLVDRLVAHLQLRLAGVVTFQPARDLPR